MDAARRASNKDVADLLRAHNVTDAKYAEMLHYEISKEQYTLEEIAVSLQQMLGGK